MTDLRMSCENTDMSCFSPSASCWGSFSFNGFTSFRRVVSKTAEFKREVKVLMERNDDLQDVYLCACRGGLKLNNCDALIFQYHIAFSIAYTQLC